MTPEQLLFTDPEGRRTSLEDLIDDGPIPERVPGLVELLDHSDPRMQLYACRMLVSWGIAEGFERLMAWAAAPDRVPWAGDPVEVDRVRGVDAGFERLADAVRTSLILLDETPELRARQIAAARALLALYDRKYFGITLTVVAANEAIRAACADATVAAAWAATRRAGAPPESPERFDLALQAAALLPAVVAIDEDAAARLGRELVRAHPGHARLAKEVAEAIGRGTGPAARAFVADLARPPGDHAAMAITIELLRAWSERICNLAADDAGEVAKALGIGGKLAEQGGDAVSVEPPPAGAKEVTLGRLRGAFTRVEIVFDRELLRAEFDRAFGEGRLLPRVGPGRPYIVAYQVALAGAPFTCEVLAKIPNYDDEPHAGSVVGEVNLRRDRAAR